MTDIDINIGLIFITALVTFILGLITEYLIDINITKVATKITYIIIILVMWWIAFSNPTETTEQMVDTMTRLTYYFVNTIIPLIIGEAFGDAIAKIINK